MSGVVACGVVYALIGLIVMKTGVKWIERLMPPVVTGAVVMVIGLNLAPLPLKEWVRPLSNIGMQQQLC